MSKVEAWVTLPGLLGANKAQGGLAGSGSGCWLGGDKFRGSLGRKHDLIHSFICKYLLRASSVFGPYSPLRPKP